MTSRVHSVLFALAAPRNSKLTSLDDYTYCLGTIGVPNSKVQFVVQFFPSCCEGVAKQDFAECIDEQGCSFMLLCSHNTVYPT
jgi:hypothetical protein